MLLLLDNDIVTTIGCERKTNNYRFLGEAHICFWQIFFLVLPPRLQGDCHPSSRVAIAVMSFSSRRRPHRSHLPSGTQGGTEERL